MLRKFVSSFLAIVLMVGCSSASSASKPKDPAGLASTIIEDLGLEENVDEVQARIIPGLFFFEDDVVSASSFYAADKLADCVGVFTTSDPDSCKNSVQEYLASRKAQLEMYAPSEVFKVDNAVIEANENTVIMIVCENIQDAKEEAEKLLSE